MSIAPLPTDALLVIDLQNDFCPGGALAVPEGDQIVHLINRLAQRFEHVILTQDWHPRGHISFASAHPGTTPFTTIEVAYGMQTLWPDHCVQDTMGAAFREDLNEVTLKRIERFPSILVRQAGTPPRMISSYQQNLEPLIYGEKLNSNESCSMRLKADCFIFAAWPKKN